METAMKEPDSIERKPNPILIEGDRGNAIRSLKDLVDFRDLILVLAWRDYKVRYAQSVLGFFWAILQPLATLLIFVLVFSRIARVETGEIPYPLFAQAGMIAWVYFAFLISQGGESLLGAQAMIKKIYFPRLVIPLSKAFVGLIDFAVSFMILILLSLYYGYVPSTNIIYLPLFIVLIVLGGLGVGIWVAALTVRFRDVKHVLPFLVQLGMYISPVAYGANLVPYKYQIIYSLNPLVGIINGIRWCLFDTGVLLSDILTSALTLVVLFMSSIWFFLRVERQMADIL